VSIQDDVKYVKRELSGDEKVLESAFKIEELYKKYKLFIWAVVAAIFLFFVGSAAMDAMKQSKLEDANNAFLTLQTKPDDSEALNTLKSKNPALFELYTFSKAAKERGVKALNTLVSSKNTIISDSAKYTVAAIEKKPVDSKLYKEMSLLEEAYISIKAGDIQNAKAKLELIDGRSPVSMLARLLEHSSIKAK
jgi:hypothetical protein